MTIKEDDIFDSHCLDYFFHCCMDLCQQRRVSVRLGRLKLHWDNSNMTKMRDDLSRLKNFNEHLILQIEVAKEGANNPWLYQVTSMIMTDDGVFELKPQVNQKCYGIAETKVPTNRKYEYVTLSDLFVKH